MKRILTLLLVITLLTACSAETTNNDYKFRGESDHWEAEYSYKGTETWGEDGGIKTYTNEDSYEFVLKYKGTLEELSSMRKLEYSYSTLHSNGKTIQEFSEPTTTITFTSSGEAINGAKVNEDEVIQVNVKWNNFEESILLENKIK